ncbi:MAG: DHH family phosphoesterase [Methylotenera sp.]
MQLTNNKLPKSIIKSREINKVVLKDLVGQGFPDWLAIVLSSRLDNSISKDKLYSDDLASIEDPSSIPDMDKAVKRIVQAILNKERVVFACDHDMDGTGSAAVLWTAFTENFGVDPTLLSVITSHRLTEGYGITLPVVDRILATNCKLVISADKGSSDEPRIKILSEHGIDVIVTDHHEIGEDGPPKSAFAVVNPIREESTYDKHICGAAVAFLTMAKVRSALIETVDGLKIPSLASLLDYVAVATIADCVSMKPTKSHANRTFVKRGLQLINRGSRACWKVFCEDNQGPVDADTIGFKLAPAVAAAGRLDWAEAGFKFLICKTTTEAKSHWLHLQEENSKRKDIEKRLREKAFAEASEKEGQSIVIFLEDGHSGVHGITASRIVESFGKPAGIFSPKGLGSKDNDAIGKSKIASGSFRGVPGLHVRNALADVNEMQPGLLIGFGGHHGAAGASILISEFENFIVLYEKAVNKQLGDRNLYPEIYEDGEIPNHLSYYELLEELEKLEPWGRDFPYPTFIGTFEIKSIKSLGDGTHLKFTFVNGNDPIDAIWFNVTQEERDFIQMGGKYTFLYKVKSNWYRERKKIQLQIVERYEENNK